MMVIEPKYVGAVFV